MKKPLVFLVLFVLLACQNKESKSNGSQLLIDEDQIAFAKNLADKILSAQKNGDVYQLSVKEATSRMVKGLDAAIQKRSYEQIKSLYGDYKNLEFHSKEGYKEQDESYSILRFKGKFESDLDVEVRTVFNNEGKLAGFFVKPWQDKL